MNPTFFSRKTALVFLAGLGVAALVQNAWYWSQLPERVAIHFGPNGEPNSWLDRTGATLMMVALQILMPLFFVGIAWSIKFFPPNLVNIPHREYWLHPDRREKTLAQVNFTLSWVAVALSGLTMAMNHLTFIANKSGEGLQVPWCLATLGCFLALVFTLVGRMAWGFRLPKTISSPSA